MLCFAVVICRLSTGADRTCQVFVRLSVLLIKAFDGEFMSLVLKCFCDTLGCNKTN